LGEVDWLGEIVNRQKEHNERQHYYRAFWKKAKVKKEAQNCA
jgi:hypothetical protein